jgi:hypothetical protein
MATPLINALRIQGGTFYTFTSAANDISKTFTDDDARFVFSKFVLLDLPDVATPTANYENYIVWEGIGSYYGGTALYPNSSIPPGDLSTNENINFAQAFQNYLLNFEQLVLDGSNTLAQSYDPTQKYTVSERLFWKFLANVNAIRFRNASAAESTQLNRYTEEDPTQYYKRVVKYIGDIDVVNNVSRDGHSYSEVYLNVPVTHGNTPVVLFKTLADNNYSPNRIWSNGNNYVDGRDSGSTHPTGLSLTAYYDKDSTDQYISWSSFGDVSNWAGNATTTGSPKPVLLSKMDGIILDTDADSYKPIVDDPTVALISEFNATDAAQDFSFNAALVYYDVYSASNPLTRGRNLYGILVLDDYVNQGSGSSYLKRFDKFKPNKITKLNGNGYGLKLNLKFDTSADNVGVETIINDYQTFSMDLFIDASTRMQEAADLFLEQKLEIIAIKQQIDTLNQYFFSQGTLNALAQRVSALEASLNNANLAFQSSTTLLDLINQNANNISEILSGNLSINLTYNTDVLKFGDGIILDTSVPNQVKIVNRVQSYNNFMSCLNTSGYIQTTFANGQTFGNAIDNNILVLGKFTNYFKQYNTNPNPLTGIEDFGDTVYINIKDKDVRWKNGQTLRFVFQDKINTGGLDIVFRTDSENVFGNGTYGKIMAIIPSVDLLSDRPIFEITCTDENQYLFNIDILR